MELMHAEKLRKQQQELELAKIDIVCYFFFFNFYSLPIKAAICDFILTVRLINQYTMDHTIMI